MTCDPTAPDPSPGLSSGRSSGPSSDPEPSRASGAVPGPVAGPPARAGGAAGGLDAARLAWYLADPAVATSRHAATAAGLAGLVEPASPDPGDVPGASGAVPDAGLVTRVALLLRAVSDDVRGRREAAGECARRLPRPARPGGDLTGAGLARADLRGAPLRGARLTGADLRDADLRGADLLGTDLAGADVRGADLRDAMFLTPEQVAAARGDDRTRLPVRLDRPACWS